VSELYYDYTSIAVYMSKAHGVKYITPEKITYTHEWLDFFFDIDGTDIVDNGGEHYIHSDSYHIIEPQEGDRDKDGYTYDDKIKAWVSVPYDDKNYGECVRMKAPEKSATARRDNKPFFTPQQ